MKIINDIQLIILNFKLSTRLIVLLIKFKIRQLII